MSQFTVVHQECPGRKKLDSLPIFEDVTRPRGPEIKLDREFEVLKCPDCGLEISLHWKEPK